MRRSPSVLITLAVVLTAITSAAGGAQAAVPGNFVKHAEPNWVWFGPANYFAASGAYGITISGPGRIAPTIDYGGSSIFCDGTPDQHFAAQRRAFAANLQRAKFRKVSKVKSSGGTYSQSMKFSGRANGTRITGELGFQYSSYDGQYCYSASLYKGVKDDKRAGKSLRLLKDIWHRTYYSGPGLPIDPNTGLP
ncbi:MAG: hypothetical protein KDB58_14935 [Solirubrobacterales bacterium]|nr:hypothetical protein [Solirubrobacterales bacterium]MCB8970711.1 hypothetical protein [Thermoleophilales bacterium]MCO5328324.1 hypothetical protein [Solirubrobacterales bacterium]